VSIEALCADNTSLANVGVARALIDTLLLSLVGVWTAATWVIFPPTTVIWTCTGPHLFVSVAPVYVPSASVDAAVVAVVAVAPVELLLVTAPAVVAVELDALVLAGVAVLAPVPEAVATPVNVFGLLDAAALSACWK
jgi:hypothetical protein